MERAVNRYVEIAKINVEKLNLNLNGLTVLTECASKAYGFIPFMAAIAGAEVHAMGRNSAYGTFNSNRDFICELLQKEHIEDRVTFYETAVPDEIYSKIDILTNSGFLRPITRNTINKLKKSAVIPLMWETWEIREGEIDIQACQEKLIPVIGTNENFKDADMFSYPGMLALKLLFEAGLEIANNKFVLAGGGLTGELIAKTLINNNVDFLWFGNVNGENKNEMLPYSDLRKILEMKRVDAILVADHVFGKQIIGRDSLLNFHDLKYKFPFIKLCHICGNIDSNELRTAGLDCYPDSIKPFGYMSYETINLGWEPVIILASAGLKVGELASRARQSGMSVEDTIKTAVKHGIGMDFEGGFMNFNYGY
jgi:hypothetical protein